jgi:hypothetical protein
MEKKCQQCGGELMEGSLAGMHVASFYPKGQEQKIFSKHSRTVCDCCKKCGLIQNIRAVELDKLV